MAYDEGLAERIRAELGDDDVTERKMFGGIAFMCANMAVGIVGDDCDGGEQLLRSCWGGSP